MKIVFFGTSGFAMPSLRALMESRHKVLALVTQPDSKRGRDLLLSPPPTKVLAFSHNIPIHQPVNASSTDSVEYLKRLNADLFVVVSFGQILKKAVLEIPRLYSVNLHGSLLPKYRGAAPTNWAIINGDKTTGVTIIRLSEKLDEGDIILKKEIDIDKDDTNITLSENMAEVGAAALVEAMDMIERAKVSFSKQDSSRSTYAHKLKKEDGLIDWNESAIKIHNKVRGLVPWPGAYTHYNGKTLKILVTEICYGAMMTDKPAGSVVDIIKGKGIMVKTGVGDICVKYIQLEGKKAMDTDSFIRGHKIIIGDKLHS
jgi:methionyl-tRNA formyltransferase